jgi:hypothetical protein
MIRIYLSTEQYDNWKNKEKNEDSFNFYDVLFEYGNIFIFDNNSYLSFQCFID